MKIPKLAIGNNLNQIAYPSNISINSKPQEKIKDILLTQMYANKLMDKVHSNTNYKCTIAGGFARDLYFNKHPRDLDIFILHEGDEPDFLVISKIYEIANKVFDRVPHINEGSNINNTFTNFKCLYNIDLIIQNRGFVGKTDYLFTLDFDTNINQFIIRDNKPVFVGKHEGELKFYRSINPDRINKLIKYAKEVNWL